MYIILRSVLLVCFFILHVIEVSASVQEVVQGFIGDSAVLPCHPGERKLTVITAHWRYNDIKNVYDIISGRGMTKEQDQEYKGRTKTFPAEYSKGNFSVKLGNLQKSDEGSYCCFITEFDLNECINLQVKEKPRGIQEQQNSNGGVINTAMRIVSMFIPVFSVTALLCL